uniref:Pneumococcal histidine triad protein D truncation n=1 Tax=Ganoderma boninense TaxID=34458 RepID=A0A5K1K292_9APHY|nr:Pneumococcal histidine triad protein D truncation [Ganoderma boninense]
MYNLYADKLLGLNFVAQSVVDTQTQFLNSLLATASEFGLPIDSDAAPFGNAAWIVFASAFMSDNNVRDSMISSVHNHANTNTSAGVFPERYNTTDNSIRNGGASPALGGMFAHLALTLSNQTITRGSANGDGSGGGNGKSGSSSNVGAIVGGVIGGLAIVGIAAAILVVILRKRRRQQELAQAEKPELGEQEPHHPTLAPYYHHGHGPISEYAPVPRSDTTAGFAGVGAADGGAGLGLGAGMYPSSTAMAYAADGFESGIGAGAGAGGARDPSPPSKAREAALNRTHHYAPSLATSSNVGSQTGSASSRDPLSPGAASATGTGTGSISSTDVMGLRNEVENLRRVMQEIRAERLEPPPEYVEE